MMKPAGGGWPGRPSCHLTQEPGTLPRCKLGCSRGSQEGRGGLDDEASLLLCAAQGRSEAAGPVLKPRPLAGDSTSCRARFPGPQASISRPHVSSRACLSRSGDSAPKRFPEPAPLVTCHPHTSHITAAPSASLQSGNTSCRPSGSVLQRPLLPTRLPDMRSRP